MPALSADAIFVSDLRAHLGITSDADLVELMARVDEAAAEYAEWVRPLPGTYTESMSLPTILPRGTTSATATAGGQSVQVVLARSGLLAGSWWGPVTVTYTVGPVPLNHRGAILADVAEYWSRTQRTGGEAGRPGFDDPFDAPGRGSRPVTMWPRIRALATSVVA